MAVDKSTAVSEALALLDSLTRHPDSKDPRTGILNPSHIKDCKAVLFQTSTKAGAGVAVQSTHGFLLLKTPEGGWSAPLWVGAKSWSAGLTLGYAKVHTVIVLHSDKAVEKAKAGAFTVGLDFNLVVYKLDVGAGAGLDFTNQKDLDAISFSTAQGLIADFSLRGADMHHDTEANKAEYNTVDVATILAAPVPPEFEPLAAKLEELAAQGGVSGLTWQPHANTAAERGLMQA